MERKRIKAEKPAPIDSLSVVEQKEFEKALKLVRILEEWLGETTRDITRLERKINIAYVVMLIYIIISILFRL